MRLCLFLRDTSCQSPEQAVTLLQNALQKSVEMHRSSNDGSEDPLYVAFQKPDMIGIYFILLNTLTTEDFIKPFESIFESLALLNNETRKFVDTPKDPTDPNISLYTSTLNLLDLPNFSVNHTPALATLINKMQGPSASSKKGATDTTQLLIPFLLQDSIHQNAVTRRRDKMTPEQREQDIKKEQDDLAKQKEKENG